MSNGSGNTPEVVDVNSKNPRNVMMTEETRRTLVMAAATLASGTMSAMITAEWNKQLPNVVEAAFKLVLKEYEKLP